MFSIRCCIWHLNPSSYLWMVDGIAHGLVSHLEPMCSLGLNCPLASCGLPENKTLIRKSFWNWENEAGGR